jgi:hypothetical protein
LNRGVRFGMLLSESAIRSDTKANYDGQFKLFIAYCRYVHIPPVHELLLDPQVIDWLGPRQTAARAEVVLIGFTGWMACLLKAPKGVRPAIESGEGGAIVQVGVGAQPDYHYKASTIVKYARNVKRLIEQECGIAFGGGLIPSMVKFPRVLKGVVAHRNESVLERLVIAPQHLLEIADYMGIRLQARRGRGPLVTFKHDYTHEEKVTKLVYFGACLDGFLLTLRSSEFVSRATQPDKFRWEAELSRADVVYAAAPEERGMMHTKRYKGDKKKLWPAKELLPAKNGLLCVLAVRRLYEQLHPVPDGVDPAKVPYWQLADGTALTRTRLQTFLQQQMKRMGHEPSVYKSHSLRKGGVTALLAAGVSLPQIQLMARWTSSNMAQLYAKLATNRTAEIMCTLGSMASLELTTCESKFWGAYTADRHSFGAG